MQPAFTSRSRATQGFTLVELSIALVIIGLIIGGVLVGRDLIRAAQVNAGIHQLEGYESAVNNFRMRFKGIPGDLGDATSQFSTVSWPALVNGDGDGTLRDITGAIDPTAFADPVALKAAYATEINQFNGELPQFWYQLSAAKMVDSQFDGQYTLGASFPASKAGSGGITAYGVSDDANYFHIGMRTPTDTVGRTVITANALTPEEALKMDEKIDDGHPLQGTVRAAGGTNFSGNVVYHEIAWLEQDNPLAFAARTLAHSFLSSAHATSTTVSRDACIFKIAAEGDDTAHYAVGAGGVNCQLRVRWR